MSAPAPTSPSVVRSASTAHRPSPSYGSPSDRPHRTQSTSVRRSLTSDSNSHGSSSSHKQAHGHSRTSSQQANLTNVARRDFEQTSLAKPPSSHRNSSRDRGHDGSHPARQDSVRTSHRTSTSRHDSSRHQYNTASSGQASSHHANGASHDPHSRAQLPTQGKRRTTIDTQTGHWGLGKTIGAGSMGKVKLAKNLDTGEQVAVKIVPRQSTDDHRTQADRERAEASKEVRTAREAAIVSLVNHPYICGMRDVIRTNYHWYMLFEYVNGGQMLDYIISHGKLKEKQARKFGRQIASALDYCHRNSIVHRDLKIENILISKTGDIKIIDFGLSNLFSPRSLLKTFCGSLYFAAPELLQAKQYTGPEVDVWSFGIVLYVLVCGKVPFDDQSMPALHSKIKAGKVEYPPWLSAECKNLISRMLVTDPRQRASLTEIMNHPWITKGFNTPPENYLPYREPLQLPLDTAIIDKMTGFDFGSPEHIRTQLEKVLSSEEYQNAVRANSRRNPLQTPETERKRGMFEFYKRRNSISSRDTLAASSSEQVQSGSDPTNAWHPLISVYYLVREKIERERQEANPGALSIPSLSNDRGFTVPGVAPPEAAHTNHTTYEMAGEKPTGGRSRPRARTHGEDEVNENLDKMKLQVPAGPTSPAIITPPNEQIPAKKENTAVGLLRRFSTRRHRNPDKEAPSNPNTPGLTINSPGEEGGSFPRKSFSVRRTRDRNGPSSTSLQAPTTNHQPDLLSPPPNGSGFGHRLRGLARSTSVNSGDNRRRLNVRRGVSEGPPSPPAPATSGSERSSLQVLKTEENAEEAPGSSRSTGLSSRPKSLGHARRESIQARRAKREMQKESNVPEETDADLVDESRGRPGHSQENMKPIFLKGLFSTSTTSTKPVSFIRADIIRVLKQLNVEYHEVRGGFSCRHTPSIDLNKMNLPASPVQSGGPSSHRRKISFTGFGSSDKERDDGSYSPQTPRTPGRSRRGPDRSFINTDESEDSDSRDNRPRRARPAGETSTHVRDDTGESMILEFEIFIIKVPFINMHGIQFKKVDGNMMSYKNMAQEILKALKL